MTSSHPLEGSVLGLGEEPWKGSLEPRPSLSATAPIFSTGKLRLDSGHLRPYLWNPLPSFPRHRRGRLRAAEAVVFLPQNRGTRRLGPKGPSSPHNFREVPPKDLEAGGLG